MRLPNTAHTTRPWRIHEFTPRFRLEDVWALPTPGGPDDFHLLVEGVTSGESPRHRAHSRAARALWAIRLEARGAVRLGRRGRRTRLQGFRRSATGCRRTCATPLPDRQFDTLPFPARSICSKTSEAAEIANKTVHGVMHMGWVRDGTGGYHGQMAVLVKPNGFFGDRVHGGDQAVPASVRIPADDPADRATVAGARQVTPRFLARWTGRGASAPRPRLTGRSESVRVAGASTRRW